MPTSAMGSGKSDLAKYNVTVTDKNNTVLTEEALANTVIEDESFYHLLSVIDRRIQMSLADSLQFVVK